MSSGEQQWKAAELACEMLFLVPRGIFLIHIRLRTRDKGLSCSSAQFVLSLNKRCPRPVRKLPWVKGVAQLIPFLSVMWFCS
jgi:hypothetical protein